MKVLSAEFVKSVICLDALPKDGRPEIAFVGRSNVGKSTLLNRLLGRKGLAKTSGTPGKTQTLNFFDVNRSVYFVDLPGYGFAKAPKSLQEHWMKVMTGYLLDRKALKLVVVLLDSRHAPSAKDHDMLTLLDDVRVPVLIVATKIDKLKRGQRQQSLNTIRETLGLDNDVVIVPFSGETGEGAPVLWRMIDEAIA